MATVIADGTYLLTRACHSPGVRTPAEAVSEMLGHLFQLSGMGRVVAVFDGRRPDFRLALLPTYKQKPPRAPDPEREAEDARVRQLLKDAGPLAREGLLLCGVPYVRHPDHEADDQACRLGQFLVSMGDSVIAASDDSDWLQMTRFGITVHRPRKGQVVDARRFSQDHGFAPEFYPLFLAMTGTHNAVPGVDGIGPVRAGDIIRKLEEPTLACLERHAALRNTAKGDKTHRWDQKVLDSISIVQRNLRLIDLDLSPLTTAEMAELLDRATEETRGLDLRHSIVRARELGIAGVARWATRRAR